MKKGTKEGSTARPILFSLVMSRFAMSPSETLTGLLLIEMGLTFGRSVGVMGQIRTVSSIVSVISALLMGFLSIRFRHKSLLLIGLLFIGISALTCSFASNFSTMLISFPITGLGLAIIRPMSVTLVADHFPLEKRSNAIGWVNAGGALSYIIGVPIIGFIASFGGWRWAFLGFVLPVSFLSFLLAAKGVPSFSSSYRATMSKRNYLEGFKKLLSNRSAIACLVGTALYMAAFQAVLIYGVSFFRQRFLISTGFASFLLLSAAVCYMLGSIISGRFVDSFGRKLLTALAVFLAGIFTVCYNNLPNLWLSLAFFWLASLFLGIVASTSDSLTLEQIPGFRGTIMSIKSAAQSVGSALGAGVGGLALVLYDYEFVGIFLGAMGITAAAVFYLLTLDPLTPSKGSISQRLEAMFQR